MKRLLADGMGPIFQICKVFRNGEVTAAHNPEFTMLEFYRPDADYRDIMDHLERALAEVEAACNVSGPFSQRPYERLTVREAVLRHAGFDLRDCPDSATLAGAAAASGARMPGGRGGDGVRRRLLPPLPPEGGAAPGAGAPAAPHRVPRLDGGAGAAEAGRPHGGGALRALRARGGAGQRLLGADRLGRAAAAAGRGARAAAAAGAGGVPAGRALPGGGGADAALGRGGGGAGTGC